MTSGHDVAAQVAGWCVVIIGYALMKRLSQVVLFVLNHGRRSE